MSAQKRSKQARREARAAKKPISTLMQDGAFLLNANNHSAYEYVGMGLALSFFTLFLCFVSKSLYTNMNSLKWTFTVVLFVLGVLGLLAALAWRYSQGKINLEENKNNLLSYVMLPVVIIMALVLYWSSGTSVPLKVIAGILATGGFGYGIFLFVRKKTDMSLTQLFVMGYIFFGFISALLSSYGHDVWVGQGRYEGFFAIFVYSCIFLLIGQFGKYHKVIVYALACSMIFFGLIAFGQYMGANVLNLYPGTYTYRNTLFLSTMGNIDVVSGFIALALPIMFAAYVLYEGKYRYFMILPAFFLNVFVQMITNVDSGKFGLLAALMFAIPIFCTQAKRIVRVCELFLVAGIAMIWQELMHVTIENGARSIVWSADGTNIKYYLIVMAVVAIAWLFFSFKTTDYSDKAGKGGFYGALVKVQDSINKIKLSPKMTRIIIIGAVAVVILAVLVFIYTYSGSSTILTQLSHFLHGHLDDEAGSGRGIVWKYTVKLIGENLWFGTGPDTYKDAFMEYSKIIMEVLGVNVYFDYAHNDLLQIASNTGIFAIISYLGFVFSLGIRALRRLKYNPLIALFGLGVVGYFVHVFFGFSVPILSPLFWVVAGLLEKCVRQTDTESGVNLLDPVEVEQGSK